MDLLFLGTSSGTPTKQRNVYGLAVLAENGRGWYLVDCGEATQHQLLRTSLSINTLQAIFITHVHGDHCYGLPGLLASAALAGRKQPLPIIAPRAIEQWIKATQECTALYLPFELQFIAAEDFTSWQDSEVVVQASLLSHRVPSYAFSFSEVKREPCLDKQKLINEGIPQGPLWGQLQKGLDVEYQGKTLLSCEYVFHPYAARKMVVCGDNDSPELLRDVCQQAQVLVHEATYTEDVAAKVGDSVQHSSAAKIASFAQLAGVQNLVLTHFSPRYQDNTDQSPSIADIQAEAESHYQGQLFLAEDFARYRLSRDGKLSRL